MNTQTAVHEGLGYSPSEYITKPDLARTIAILEANHGAEITQIEKLMSEVKSELSAKILIAAGVVVGAVALIVSVATGYIGYLLP